MLLATRVVPVPATTLVGQGAGIVLSGIEFFHRRRPER
jgi:hypothetical protein